MNETRPDLILRSLRTILPGGIAPAAVYIAGGVIADVRGYEDIPGGCRVVDCKQSVLMPGLVDAHVHVNDPGRAEWEGFDSATRAAAAGGVTTLVDMPLNSIPATTSVEALQAKKNAAAGHCWMDVEFWGGVVPGNASQLEPLWRAGVLGFKCFLVPSGVPEFECVTERDLREAMPILARLGAPLLVHAELPGPIEAAVGASPAGPAKSYANYLRSRPRDAELDAIALMLQLCAQYGTRVHIVHLAAADAVSTLRAARASGLPVTVETCPHYLSFAAEEIPDGSTHFKCAPPIRERENRERLWMALDSGVIDFIATDHSPCPAAMKQVESGDFMSAWGGIASLGLALPVVWSAARARRFPLERVSQWLSGNPAKFCGIGGRVGTIASGYAADMAVFDPEQQREWRGYHRMTPYANEILYGVVEQTYLGGRLIFDHGGYGGTPKDVVEFTDLANPGLQRLNAESNTVARFLQCCGASKWAKLMDARRPFTSVEELHAAADEFFPTLSAQDWREAFAAHPRIGDKAGSAWSKQEQAGAAGPAMEELVKLNHEYFRKFGYIYIVCATGKSAEEMLALLKSRLENDPASEIANAAAEQKTITHLRLEKMLQS